MPPDPLPLSALQHLVFCERQCALIHLEGLWLENRLTAQGRILHERVDHEPGETRGDVVTLRGVRLAHRELGLSGRADVVELVRLPEPVPPGAARVPGREGRYRVRPVEYKRGRPKAHAADRVQLCAQALCLEEMWNCAIEDGALFYGKTRRRRDVPFDEALREETRAACRRLHELMASRVTPPATRAPKCDRCSLLPRCRPETTGRSARAYLEGVLAS